MHGGLYASALLLHVVGGRAHALLRVLGPSTISATCVLYSFVAGDDVHATFLFMCIPDAVQDLIAEHAQGSWVWTVGGKKVLDFGCGAWGSHFTCSPPVLGRNTSYNLFPICRGLTSRNCCTQPLKAGCKLQPSGQHAFRIFVVQFANQDIWTNANTGAGLIE